MEKNIYYLKLPSNMTDFEDQLAAGSQQQNGLSASLELTSSFCTHSWETPGRRSNLGDCNCRGEMQSPITGGIRNEGGGGPHFPRLTTKPNPIQS